MSPLKPPRVFQLLLEPKEAKKEFMETRPFSPLPPDDPYTAPEHRFVANLAIGLIVVVILAFALFVGMVIHEKVQRSQNISRQPAGSVTVPLNDGNSLSPAATWNTPNSDSTNVLAPMPAPISSVTNSN